MNLEELHITQVILRYSSSSLDALIISHQFHQVDIHTSIQIISTWSVCQKCHVLLQIAMNYPKSNAKSLAYKSELLTLMPRVHETNILEVGLNQSLTEYSKMHCLFLTFKLLYDSFKR